MPSCEFNANHSSLGIGSRSLPQKEKDLKISFVTKIVWLASSSATTSMLVPTYQRPTRTAQLSPAYRGDRDGVDNETTRF